MENNNTIQDKKSMILAGVCPSNHETEDKVCKACYEELLKKYNKLKGSSDGKKSPWATW